MVRWMELKTSVARRPSFRRLIQGSAHRGKHAFAGVSGDGLFAFLIRVLDEFLGELVQETGRVAGH